jgi:hypothetical protein
MKITKSSFSLLLIVLFSVCGCATGRNPLQGWKPTPKAQGGCPFDAAICDDYKRYIDNLSSAQKALISDWDISFYDAGDGRHAVMITNVRKLGWVYNYTYTHILIYDKSNRRIKVIRYRTGKYLC